jgi:hypothetical protein
MMTLGLRASALPGNKPRLIPGMVILADGDRQRAGTTTTLMC